MNKQNIIILVIILALLALMGGVIIYRQQPLLQENQQEAMVSPTLAPQALQSTLYKVAKKPTIGPYFTDAKGMTLYTFANDTENVSNCTETCIKNWPPYIAPSSQIELPAKFGVIKRPDGIFQYTWNRMPLYYYSGDTHPGETNGNGYKNLWTVAK